MTTAMAILLSVVVYAVCLIAGIVAYAEGDVAQERKAILAAILYTVLLIIW
jgi:hypothetical protein